MSDAPPPKVCPVAHREQTTGNGTTDFDHLRRDWNEHSLWTDYADLLERESVVHSGAHGGFWTVSHHADVKNALRDHETFSSAHGHRIPYVEAMGTIPIDFDPPAHGPYRDLLVQAVSPRRVRELEPFLQHTISELVSRFVERGGGDAVTELALPLPLTVLTEIVGFSASTVATFRELTVALWADGTAEGQLRGREALTEVLTNEIRRHQRTRPDDYLSWLLRAQIDDRAIREDEVVSVLLSLAVAGHETTMNSVGSLLYLLATHQGEQSRLRADTSLAPGYVEEMLRLRTPAQAFARRTTRDADIAGTTIPRGEWVLLLNAAANRDPRQFEKPDAFDVNRSTRGHLAFGWGIHQCVGASLARLELRIVLEQLCTHPAFVLDGEATFSSLEAGTHYGPTHLPIRVTKETP